MAEISENGDVNVPPPADAEVVVVGAGFAGGSLLRNLPSSLRRPGETLLIDQVEEYAFIPLIHEVAVGRVHPDSVRVPIALNRGTSYSVLRAEVTGIDLENNILLTSSGAIKYRYLVLAPGSVAVPPPEGRSDHFQTFWSLEDALRLRSTLNNAWQVHLSRGESSPGGLTVAIVGGGATGVELAAEVAVLFGYLKRRSARTRAEEPRVVLLEATERLLGWLDPYFHEVATEELAKIGVEIRLNSPVKAADEEGIEIEGGERIPAAARVWATGIRANPLVKDLPGEHDDSGRVHINQCLTLLGHPEVYVLGDSGVYEHPRLGPLPATASVAVQQGPYVARDIERRLRGVPEERRRSFEFFDRGYVVSLGPESAVADPVGVKLRGRAAQALYRSIFLYYMKSSRGRLLTGTDWAMERTLGRVGFDYSGQHPAFSGQRGAR
ncbi:MAG: NAD(P)/FAD-dependent oxidoreductase [Actinobacteria bacterium]|nr:NAD(P)/FAD-dependent oxidoreductase [Actinomycetota bacterium]MCA1739872.1 NAD(P)/FAD-dependent oxidoreductase [Actinomycetota bacterium]